MDLDRDLNPQQREAVFHEGGPLLVLAGAGSGKTRVLTYRIARLVGRTGLAPYRILAITFTNKAADEMRGRIRQLVGEASREMWTGTFHSICARLLRQHGDLVGIERSFVIYDETDQLRLVKNCIRNLGLSDSQVRPAAVLALIDRAKNQGLEPPAGVLMPTGSRREEIEAVLRAYRDSLRQAGALDFGDLILFAHQLLREHPAVLARLRDRFRAILVDEYQDTNRAQHLFLKTLVPEGGDLCVVGDDDQSIYRWRGAEVENLLRFEKDFPGARILVLEQNYRSTANILRAAESVARGNPERHPKSLWTANDAGEKVTYLEAGTPDDEARAVAREIRSLVPARGFSFRDVAVLFRTNAQSRAFEESFLLFQIPYALVGTTRFYERTEIKDLTAYLRFLYNPKDSVSLQRILNRPARGIGKTTEEALVRLAAERGVSLWEGMEQAVTEPGLVSATAARRIREVVGTLVALRERAAAAPSLVKLLEDVLDRSGYSSFLESLPDKERRVENVEELLRTASAFEETQESTSLSETLGAFLEKVALVSEADQYSEKANVVTLMTLHCAKGLEFEIVFLVGMEDGLLPHQRSSLDAAGLAEERRLCYVGMTRARRKLYLTRARLRTRYGERQEAVPSPFLLDIPAELLETEQQRIETWPAAEPRRARRQPAATAAESGVHFDFSESQIDLPALPGVPAAGRRQTYRVGDRIEHEDLGRGIVRKVEGGGEKEKITVQFEHGGIRKLMARLSPIRKIER